MRQSRFAELSEREKSAIAARLRVKDNVNSIAEEFSCSRMDVDAVREQSRLPQYTPRLHPGTETKASRWLRERHGIVMV
jgi:hypothetical protein